MVVMIMMMIIVSMIVMMHDYSGDDYDDGDER
jgi:hypothetical protein